MTDAELRALRASCAFALTHHAPDGYRTSLREIARDVADDEVADSYGSGDRLQAFEGRIATELGMESAVFMPTGTLAQQIALRIWCARRGNASIAFHPTCHLEIHEARAYAFLQSLHAMTVGNASRLVTPDDVRALGVPVGAFVVELPQREIGAQLPAWNDLLELVATMRATGAAVHLDGARLWEAAPHYGRTHAEIASLFDSVYVSFYKGLGALAGAVLAGPADFIAEARVWQHRHGGRPVTIAPYLLSAERAFARNLPKMAAFRERAIAIAREISDPGRIDVVPNPPHTNTFHVHIRGDRDALEARAHAHARERGTFVFARLAPTVVPQVQRLEFVVGDATMALSVGAIAEILRAVVA